MCALIFRAGDRGNMFIKRPASGKSISPVNEEAALSAFKNCLTLIKKENPAAVIFNLIYTIKETYKVELYYALRGKHEISPMGIIKHEYKSLAELKGCMLVNFSRLEYPR